jgi:hypothetical protein
MRDRRGVPATGRELGYKGAPSKVRQIAFPLLWRGSILCDTHFTKTGQEPKGEPDDRDILRESAPKPDDVCEWIRLGS